MGAPWFFPLFGGALLCGEALELAGALLARRRAKGVEGAQEAQDETEPLARQRALADSAMRLMALLFLLVWTGLATYAALTAHISPVIWLFPAAGLVMLAAFVATGGALRGGGGQPPRAQSARDDARPAPCPSGADARRPLSDTGRARGRAVGDMSGALRRCRGRRCRGHRQCPQSIQKRHGGRRAAHLPALRGDGAGGRKRLPALREARAGGKDERNGRGNLRARPSVQEGN